MGDRHTTFSHPFHNYGSPLTSQRRTTAFELADRRRSSAATSAAHVSDVPHRRSKQQVVIDNPLTHLTDEELVADVRGFVENHLLRKQPDDVDPEAVIRAARVAKDIRAYDEVSRNNNTEAGIRLPVRLDPDEKEALKSEKDSLFSQRGMLSVFLSVTLAAFLQGFVQSSINGASLYPRYFGIDDNVQGDIPDWKLGAVNAAPFLAAALLGCWLSLPSNDLFGRRGSMAFAAILILASSIGSAACRRWQQLFAARIINGIGMGIKAVSTPILASETAIGYWRGTFLLAWQLWVAFGIFVGFAFNLIFTTASGDEIPAMLILGAPCVPCIFLLVGLWFCPESPRWYLRQNSRSFDPLKALKILRGLRETELQALRDVYLIYKSVQEEEASISDDLGHPGRRVPRRGILEYVRAYLGQYWDLLTKKRLRNALISSSMVAIAQQFCGINVFAFYSGNLFLGLTEGDATDRLLPMVYSLGFGAVNFVFALPAIRTIDTLGRRKWLIMTLPMMCLFMMSAALATRIGQDHASTRGGIVALFVFLFTAAYSPGLGPIPFTLASESFPLSHREAGCSVAIAANLFFAGLLSILFPSMNAKMGAGGALGLFSGLCFVALVLVFLLVEETKRRSLESLNKVFSVPKTKFMRFQLGEQLPWFVQRYVLRRMDVEKPSLYTDLIWGRETAAGKAGYETRPAGVVGNCGEQSPTQTERPPSMASNDSAHE